MIKSLIASFEMMTEILLQGMPAGQRLNGGAHPPYRLASLPFARFLRAIVAGNAGATDGALPSRHSQSFPIRVQRPLATGDQVPP
jgi:hypothetical protein